VRVLPRQLVNAVWVHEECVCRDEPVCVRGGYIGTTSCDQPVSTGAVSIIHVRTVLQAQHMRNEKGLSAEGL